MNRSLIVFSLFFLLITVVFSKQEQQEKEEIKQQQKQEDDDQLFDPGYLSPNRNVLNALWNSTNGLLWDYSSEWATTSDTCDWYGVNCYSSSGNSLDLSGNNLVGTLPNFVVSSGSLGLYYINLNDNSITGSVPQLDPAISYFYASNNKLTGSIKTVFNCKYISLSNNQLTGPLPTFTNTITYLDLSNNQLSGSIPFSMSSKIIYSSYIDLSNNLFTSILIPEPDEGATLDFSGNPFKCPIPLWAQKRAQATCVNSTTV